MQGETALTHDRVFDMFVSSARSYQSLKVSKYQTGPNTKYYIDVSDMKARIWIM